MVNMKDYRQGEGASDNDIRKEFIDSYMREPSADGQMSSDMEARLKRRIKRIDDIRRKKDMESTYHHGRDRIIKERESTGHIGHHLRTDLPMDRLPEAIAYEQLGELHIPNKPWRCPACGTLHMMTVPETYKNGTIVAGCSFCGCEDHWFNRLNFKTL